MRHPYLLFIQKAILVCCTFWPLWANSQGWQRFYGAEGDQRTFVTVLLPDGSVALAGSSGQSTGGKTDLYYLHTDASGNLQQQQVWGTADSSEYAIGLLRRDTQLLIIGVATFPVDGPLQLTQRSVTHWNVIDDQGNRIFYEQNPSFYSSATHAVSWGNNTLVAGSEYLPHVDAYSPRPYWFLIDSTGQLRWQHAEEVLQFGDAQFALPLDAGSALILSKELNSGFDAVLYRINTAGQIMSSATFLWPGDDNPVALTNAPSGNVLMTGDRTVAANNRDLFVAAIQLPLLDTLWRRTISLPGNQVPHAVLALQDGGLVLAGENIPEGATSRDAFLARLDSNGHLLWFKTYGGLKGDIFWDIQQQGDGFLLAGQTASFSSAGDLQAWLVHTDAQGNVWRHQVSGRVVQDVVQDCSPGLTEPALPQWLVQARKAGNSLYTMTDSSGVYRMQLDTGLWQVAVLPVSGYWLPCEDSIAVDFQAGTDSLTADFPVQALYACPLLDVDIATPWFRRCFENTNQVRYYNYGTAAAPQVSIRVVLDPFLSITGSNMPFTQHLDTVWFQVGNVDALAGGGFSFNTLTNCDSTCLGQTHCLEAHVFPDSSCYTIDPDWDGSHLEVQGYCAGDSVVMTVSNTGLGMQGVVNFIITEDQIIFRQSDLQLLENQDTTFVVYPNGATVTIVVTQAPGHPGNNQPMLVVEGCGSDAPTTGYSFQFPQNDGDPATDIECRQNIGAFDPNDKTGLPLGVSEAGVIAPETRLEYLIRFQNTGTDTAFRVEIRDTLSAHFDLSTLKIGASSHPNRWQVTGAGVLQFIFDPIELPDSNTNFLASQGFVKYSITPQKGVAPGTELHNRASIYFDFNPPVSTNTTLHTLENPIPYLFTKTTVPGRTPVATPMLMVQPNPSRSQILVQLQQPSNSGRLYVAVRNVLGAAFVAPVLWQQPDQSPLEIQVASLPAGMYVLEATNDQGVVVARQRLVKL